MHDAQQLGRILRRGASECGGVRRKWYAESAVAFEGSGTQQANAQESAQRVAESGTEPERRFSGVQACHRERESWCENSTQVLKATSTSSTRGVLEVEHSRVADGGARDVRSSADSEARFVSMGDHGYVSRQLSKMLERSSAGVTGERRHPSAEGIETRNGRVSWRAARKQSVRGERYSREEKRWSAGPQDVLSTSAVTGVLKRKGSSVATDSAQQILCGGGTVQRGGSTESTVRSGTWWDGCGGSATKSFAYA